jgi:hypothetical protein
MMTLPPLIGISGKAGSGKDTVAAYLVEKHGYFSLAFADPIKAIGREVFDFTGRELDGDLKEVPDHRFNKSPRWVMQTIGTDFRNIWPLVWVKHLENRIRRHWSSPSFPRAVGARPLVITDVRFVDEARMLYRLGAKLIRVEREGAGAVNGVPGHVSETELDGSAWDLLIYNEGTVGALWEKVEGWLGR